MGWFRGALSVVWQWIVEWQWIALPLGVLAVILALPPFLQMFWGRAKINIKFDSLEDKEAKVSLLVSRISNPPISNPIARFLHIHRETVEEFKPIFRITRVDNGEVIVQCVEASLFDEDGAFYTTSPSLPASVASPFMCRIAARNKESGVTNVVPQGSDRSGPVRKIPVGEYIVQIKIVAAERTTRAKRKLVVRQDSLLWSGD